MIQLVEWITLISITSFQNTSLLLPWKMLYVMITLLKSSGDHLLQDQFL